MDRREAAESLTPDPEYLLIAIALVFTGVMWGAVMVQATLLGVLSATVVVVFALLAALAAWLDT